MHAYVCVDAPMSVRIHGRIRADALVSPWTQGCVCSDALAHLRSRIFLPSAQTVKTCPRVKTRPRGKHECARTSGRNGRPIGKFYRRTSV
jgi:hypothetical protein